MGIGSQLQGCLHSSIKPFGTGERESPRRTNGRPFGFYGSPSLGVNLEVGLNGFEPVGELDDLSPKASAIDRVHGIVLVDHWYKTTTKPLGYLLKYNIGKLDTTIGLNGVARGNVARNGYQFF